MQAFKEKLRQMANSPKSQLKQLLIGTIGAFLSMLVIIYSSEQENRLPFYIFSILLIFSVIYAIPGYIGIWMWRMRDVLFKEKD